MFILQWLDGYRPGGSLRAWRDFFLHSTIYGLDVQPDTQFYDERIKTYLCDSTNKQQVDNFIRSLDDIKFDIIIDDGSHVAKNQLTTLSNLYPHLKNNGYYIIEDIYPDNILKNKPKVIASKCNNNPYFLVNTYPSNMCVIYKNDLYSHIQSDQPTERFYHKIFKIVKIYLYRINTI